MISARAPHPIGSLDTTDPLLSTVADLTVQTSFDSALVSTRDTMQSALARPQDDGAVLAFRTARLELARSVAQVPPTDRHRPEIERVLALVSALLDSGLQDLPLSTAEATFIGSLNKRRWPDLLAGMLVAAAWRWTEALTLDDIPEGLEAPVARWTWNPPQGFVSEGDATTFAVFTLARLRELATWSERNRGAIKIRAAVEAYVRYGSGIPLYFNDLNLREHAELRGRILRQAFRLAEPFSAQPYPRFGRRLRVGFVNRHFGAQTETYSTLPTFEHLDREQFEVLLFTFHDHGTPLEEYCRSRASEFHVLPKDDLAEQAAMLRVAHLDVVVFGTNVTANANEVTRLATQRVAPLQVVNNSSPVTSGLPEIDLYVSGSLVESPAAAAHYSERLGLLPGPAHAFNYDRDESAAVAEFTRATFGLPEGVPVFVTAANYFKIIPELQHTWARLLAAVPESHLLVHPFNANWSNSYPVDRFHAQLRTVLADHGVDPARLVLSREQLPSRSDVKALISLGDVYLDSFPFSGVNSLVDPLQVSVPVAVWEGTSFRSRMASSLLRSLQLDELIATDEASYIALASRLATDSTYSTGLRERIFAAMEVSPIFLDRQAASDAFGTLLLKAFDAVAESGIETFRRDRSPFQLSRDEPLANQLAEIESQIQRFDTEAALAAARSLLGAHPNDSRVRRLLGKIHFKRGDAAQASVYLMAALNGYESDASLWFEIAQALRANQQTAQALEALETALRLDPSRVEGWELVVELARSVGSEDMAADAEEVIRQLQIG